MNYNRQLWQQIIDIGKKREPDDKGVENRFDKHDVHTILATMGFFDATPQWIGLTKVDLETFRYRLFDWLAMGLHGRNGDTFINEKALQVLIHAYLKTDGDPRKFIDDLRRTDYQIDTAWEKVYIYGSDS